MPERIFVTGTGTDVGKTVVSALLCAALDAYYWKPVQTGTHDGYDRHRVAEWAGLTPDRLLNEVYEFPEPVSPHLAADWHATKIDLGSIRIPQIPDNANLVTEGAGGVLVPLAPGVLMRDLILHLQLPVVIAASTGLGTINHTLMTLEALSAKHIPVRGVVLLGELNDDNRRAIEEYGNIPVVGWVPLLPVMDRPALLNAWKQHFYHRAFRP